MKQPTNIDKILDGMSGPQLTKAIEWIQALKKKSERSLFEAYDVQAHQLPVHADKRKIVTIMGGNRCLGGETEVFDPVAKEWCRVDSIETDFHVWAWDWIGNQKVIAKAKKPFIKPKDDLYLVRFEDGTEIVASPKHLFRGKQGWIECSCYISGSENLDFYPDLPMCNWGKVQKVIQTDYLRNDLVWDFEVEYYHNYFIGGVLNHNSGKSHCAGYSVAAHITGIYPDWWEGLRFHDPVDCGVISISAEQLRKSAQVKLMGEPHELGSGFIHTDLIIDKAWRQGTNGCLDWVLVKHASGGTSRVEFMSCEQEQKKFMGFARKLIWFDEEPPLNIFNEIQMRLIDLKGYIILSFYPYAGETELIQMLDKMPEKYCGHYQFSMEDNKTLDPEEVEMHKITMPDWLKESRMYGRPGAGEGRIFSFSKDDYVCDPFEIETNWRQIAGLDVGFGHATGAIRIAYDDQSMTAYVFQEYISTKNLPVVHASALRRWGEIDFKIDTSAHRSSATDGKNLFDMYREEGLNISNANTGKGSVQTSINLVNTMLSEKRLYIFNTCPELIRQMGLYRMTKNQKTGQVKVIEKDDDLIDPLRYAIMALDEARVPGTHKIQLMPKIIQWAPVDPRIGI